MNEYSAMANPLPDNITALAAKLGNLSQSQLALLDNIITQFSAKATFTANPKSDLISDCMLREMGDALRIHHCFSAEPFTKDKFEYALEKAANFCEITAQRARRGNPGHDITIRTHKYSLKTQADASIKANKVHISKFMELGKGQWGDKLEDLAGLRERFFHHLENYERILTLRKLNVPGQHFYELVEIPKSLLLRAAEGKLEIRSDSKQFPKPGYCTVIDDDGGVLFQLYFDGGSERKLQIKNLDKAHCIVHATWQFSSEQSHPAALLVE